MGNYFDDEKAFPDEASLRTALGDRYAWLEAVLGAAEGFEREWKFHGRKYGWKLKLHDGDKALLELTVTEAPGGATGGGAGAAGLRVGIAAREAEIGELREDETLGPALAALLAPGKAREGWGIRLDILGEEQCREACALVGAVAALRRAE